MFMWLTEFKFPRLDRQDEWGKEISQAQSFNKKLILSQSPRPPARNPSLLGLTRREFYPIRECLAAWDCWILSLCSRSFYVGTLSALFCPNHRAWERIQPLQGTPYCEAASVLFITMKLLWGKKLYFLLSGLIWFSIEFLLSLLKGRVNLWKSTRTTTIPEKWSKEV